MTSLCFAGLFSCFILVGAARLLAQEAAPAAVVRAQDTKGAPDEQADQLLAEMTLVEKISLIGGVNAGIILARYE